MHQYDIRIQHKGGATRAVRVRLCGDAQAIHRARQLAGDDDAVDVWRGMDCIYRRETLPRYAMAC